MDLEPSEELELDPQSTKPETKRRRNNEKGMRKMRQIHNKLNEHVRHLEDLYSEGIDKGERNDQETAETSPKVGPLISSLSTCQSAASDLDININAEHQILESLYQRYFKEMQLLEQLTEEDLTLRDVSPAFPAILNEHTGKLTHAFHKLDILKTHLHSILKTVAQGSPPVKNAVAEPIKMDNRYVMPKFPQVSKDQSHEAQNIVKEMHGILTKKDPDSMNELEKILDKVENNINVQASEYKKLEREHEDTKNKYARMKSEYQALLEEKIIIENELRSIVKLKRGPPSAGSSLLSNDQLQRPQKIQEERSSSKTHDGWNQEQGANNDTLGIAPSKDMVNLQDEASPTQDEVEELTPEKDNISRKKKQKAKLAKGRERRSSTTSRKTHPVTLADNTSQPKPLPAISEIKPADGSNKEDAAQDEPREKREKRRKYSETENSKSKSYVTHEEQQITSDVMDKPRSGQRSRRQSVSNGHKMTLSPINAQRTSGEEGRDTLEETKMMNSSTEKQIKVKHVVVQSLLVPSTLTPEADHILSPDSDTYRTAENNQDRCCSDLAQQNRTTISQSSHRLSEQHETTHIGPAEETPKSNLASETLLDSSVDTLHCHTKSVPIPEKMRETNSQLHGDGNIDHQLILSGQTKLSNVTLITEHEPGEINEINTKHQISSDGESRQATVEENGILHTSPITISKSKPPGTSSVTELTSQQALSQATKSSTNMFSTQTLAPPDVKTEAFTKPPGDGTHQNTSPEDNQMAQVAAKTEMWGTQPFEKGSPQHLLIKDESKILKDSQKTPSSTSIIATYASTTPEICKAVPPQFPPEFQKAQLSTTSTARAETLEAPLLRELSSHQRFWKQNDRWVSLPEDTKKRGGSPTPRAIPTPAQTEIKLKDLYRYEEDQTSAFWKHQKALKNMALDATPHSLVPLNTRDGGFKHMLLGKSEIQDDLSKQAETTQSSGTITMNLPAASKVRNTSNHISPGDPMERHFSTTAIKATIFPPLRNRDTPFCFSRDGEILMDSWRPQMSCPTFTKIPESIFRGSEKKMCFSATSSSRRHLLPSYQDIQTEYSTGHIYPHEGDKRKQLFLSHPGESISSKSFRLTRWQIDCGHLLMYDNCFLRSYNNLLYIQGRHMPLTQRPTGIKNPGSGITAEIYPYLLSGTHIPPMPQRIGIKNRGSRTAKMYPSLPYSIPARMPDLLFGNSEMVNSISPIFLVNGMERDLGTFYRTVPLVQWDHPVFSTLKPPHKNQGTQGSKFMKRAS